MANKLGQLTGMTPGYFVRKTPADDFDSFWERLKTPSKLDANDRVWQTKAMIAQDVFRGRTAEQIAKAHRIKMLIAPSEFDHTVNSEAALEWAKESAAQTFVSHGDCGHRIMECDGKAITKEARDFFSAP